MNRRDTIAALSGCLAVTLCRSGGAQSKIDRKRLGLLWLAPLATVAPFQAQLLERLKALGWIEHQNLTVVSVSGEGQIEKLRREVLRVVASGVDVLWAGTHEAAALAARATRTVPVVFANVAWPVETGLIESFARPGRNLTGVSAYVGLEVGGKRLEFLREIVPGARRLSWIQTPTMQETVSGGAFDILPELDKMANGLGFETRHHLVRSAVDLDEAFSAIRAWGAEALAVAGGVHTYAARQRIADFAIHHRLPSAYFQTAYVEAGGLLSYGSDFSGNVKRSGDYLDRILRGARPQELPVERPERYELAVNLRTARAMGLKVPQSILLRADRVIE